jgi:peptide/nickel transport system substrate-binding protein
MAEAGYPDGGFTLTMAYPETRPEELLTGQIMQAGAAELGITVDPIIVEWPAKVELMSSDHPASMANGWMFPTFPDPDQFYFELLHSSRGGVGAYNFGQYSNPEYDRLVEAAAIETDPDTRCDYYHQANDILFKDWPLAYIVVMHSLVAHGDYVEGYAVTPAHTEIVNAYYISLEGK